SLSVTLTSNSLRILWETLTGKAQRQALSARPALPGGQIDLLSSPYCGRSPCCWQSFRLSVGPCWLKCKLTRPSSNTGTRATSNGSDLRLVLPSVHIPLPPRRKSGDLQRDPPLD